jgi:hypothetical protein
MTVTGLSSPCATCWLFGRAGEGGTKVLLMLLKNPFSRLTAPIAATLPISSAFSPGAAAALSSFSSGGVGGKETAVEEEEAEFLRNLPPQKAARVLIYYCPAEVEAKCGGLADRLLGVLSVFLLAIISRREFVIDWVLLCFLFPHLSGVKMLVRCTFLRHRLVLASANPTHPSRKPYPSTHPSRKHTHTHTTHVYKHKRVNTHVYTGSPTAVGLITAPDGEVQLGPSGGLPTASCRLRRPSRSSRAQRLLPPTRLAPGR